MRGLLATAGFLLTLGSAAGAQAAPARDPSLTVFVVRHAERATDDPRDPNLSEAGHRRAAELARVLGDAGVTTLVASEYRRTQQTLAPLAASRGIATTVIGAGSMDSLVAFVRALPPGSRAVIASHSNLVHLIVDRLAGVRPTPLTDTEYDRLFVVTVTSHGTGSVVTLRFGER